MIQIVHRSGLQQIKAKKEVELREKEDFSFKIKIFIDRFPVLRRHPGQVTPERL